MGQSKRKKKIPLCVTCTNAACEDRCNPSQCEFHTTNFNEQKIKQMQVETFLGDAGISLTQGEPETTFFLMSKALKRRIEEND